MASKILSVIIPSFNMEKYLPRTLGSIVELDGQHLDSVEVLVVNDGSTDKTSEIAHAVEQKYPHVVRVVDKANGHYGSCINAGLKAATGEYVKVLDADDSYDTSALKCLLEKLPSCAAEGIDVVFTDFVLVYEGTGKSSVVSYDLPEEKEFDLETFSMRGQKMVMHTITYRTSLLRQIGYKQTEGMPYTDNEWALFPMRHVASMRYFKFPIYRYLVGRAGQSVSFEQSVKNVGRLETVLENVLARSREYNDCVAYCRYASLFETDLARLIYEVAFLGLPIGQCQEKISFWEERLAKLAPAVLEKLDELSLMPHKRTKIRYVRLWRSHVGMRGVCIRYVRCVNWLLRLLRRLRGIG